MAQPVFLSYARKASKTEAEVLRNMLGPELCFMDVHDLDVGDQFPSQLRQALLDARIFVAFVDATYFRRWYCLREWLLARAPFDYLLRRGAGPTARAAMLEHFVIGLGPHTEERTLERVPVPLRHTNWPTTTDTGALTTLIRSKLAGARPTLRERCDAAQVPPAQRDAIVDLTAMPLPQNTAGVPMHPRVLPQSLGARFVGRTDDIWNVHVQLSEPRLESHRIAAITAALHGGGGFGKTQLAREYLHRFGPTHYQDGCFWIDAGGGEPLDHQQYGVLRVLRPSVASLDAMREAGQDVASELADALHADAVSKSMLFVVDNVPEPNIDDPPLPVETWFPALGKVTCLITSRKRFDESGSIEPINIHVPDSHSAVILLTQDVANHRMLAETEWEEITQWVGSLPLALTLLNAAIRKAAISPKSLLEASRSENTTAVLDLQMEVLRGSVPAGALRGISEAFALSYRCLDQDSRLLALQLAWCASARIPNELLLALSTDARARVTLIDRSFLLDASGSGNEAGWLMHRVLSDFLRSQDDSPAFEIFAGLRIGKPA